MSASSTQISEQIRRTRHDREVRSIYVNDIVLIRDYLMRAIGMVRGWKSACNHWKDGLRDYRLATPLIQRISENETFLAVLLNDCMEKTADLAVFSSDLSIEWSDLADRCWQQRQDFIAE